MEALAVRVSPHNANPVYPQVVGIHTSSSKWFWEWWRVLTQVFEPTDINLTLKLTTQTTQIKRCTQKARVHAYTFLIESRCGSHVCGLPVWDCFMLLFWEKSPQIRPLKRLNLKLTPKPPRSKDALKKQESACLHISNSWLSMWVASLRLFHVVVLRKEPPNQTPKETTPSILGISFAQSGSPWCTCPLWWPWPCCWWWGLS